MTDNDKTNEYIASIQSQVMSIINSIKSEVGSDIEVEVEVRESESDE